MHYGDFLLGMTLFLFCLYSGADDAWRMEADQRIERLRKGDLVVKVVDKSGTPISGVPVQVCMTRHAFPWGTCVKAVRIMGDSPDDEVYRTHLKALFNCAVPENDLKWNAWRGAWGRGFSQEKALAALQWLQKQEFRIRGHCLVYPEWGQMEPYKESDEAALPALRQDILDHIDEMATVSRAYIDEWDVVNEPVHHREVLQALGEPLVVEWFQRARKALPDTCRLFVNEYNIVSPDAKFNRPKYERFIAGLLEANVPVEGIGFQSHFMIPPESVEDALEVFDTFAKFGLPIVVTEFDVNLKDEARQAAFTRDFMTAAFSHPACAGFVFWGFWEGAHWRPDGAMFRKDWSEKPNLLVYRDLVLKKWWTDSTGNTNADGEFAVRGFKGAYTVVVGKQEVKAVIGDAPTIVKVQMSKNLK